MFTEEMMARAKRADGKGWTRGYYACLTDSSKGRVSHRIYTGYAESEADGGELAFYPDWYEIDPETLGRCTGLRDEEGSLIYEGDIVELHTRAPGYNKTEVVCYEKGGFSPFSDAGWECEPDPEKCAIIGNIIDTPKLDPRK